MNIESAFYTLNRNQSFPFPHANCDELSNSELIVWLYRPDYFTMQVLRYFHPDASYTDLYRLRDNPSLTLLGITWMRLKYITEVCSPEAIRIQYERVHAKLRLREATLLEPWNAESACERYVCMDTFTNRIQLAFFTYIANPDTPPLSEDVVHTLEAFNAAVHSIRKIPFKGTIWSARTAYDLVPYVYFVYISELWSCVQPAACIASKIN